MKGLILRLATVVGVAVAGGVSVSAAATQQAPVQVAGWCAVSNLGSENCHFTSQAQCALSVRGVGGFCRETAFYVVSDRRVV